VPELDAAILQVLRLEFSLDNLTTVSLCAEVALFYGRLLPVEIHSESGMLLGGWVNRNATGAADNKNMSGDKLRIPGTFFP
jgi:hypothetical protein